MTITMAHRYRSAQSVYVCVSMHKRHAEHFKGPARSANTNASDTQAHVHTRWNARAHTHAHTHSPMSPTICDARTTLNANIALALYIHAWARALSVRTPRTHPARARTLLAKAFG